MSKTPPRRESIKCPTTQNKSQPHGEKKAPSHEGAVGDGYISPSIRFVSSSAARRIKSFNSSPQMAAASSIRFASGDVTKTGMARHSHFGFSSTTPFFRKKALISSQRLSGIFVFDSQPYAVASETPNSSANCFLVILLFLSHISNWVLLSSSS